MPIRKTPEECGVYVITTPSGKRYIGSTTSFRQRKYAHLSELRKGVHHSRSLQSEYIECGEVALNFELIEVCALDELIVLEQAHLDAADPGSLHNDCLIAGKSTGFSPTLETRKKIGATKIGNKNALGIRRSPETRARMSAAQKVRAEQEAKNGADLLRSAQISKSTNTSGYMGVCLHKGSQKWQAQVRVMGKRKYLGTFETPELAYVAICEFKRSKNREVV